MLNCMQNCAYFYQAWYNIGMADTDMGKKDSVAPIPRPEGGQAIVAEWLNNQLLEMEQHVDKDVLGIFGDITENIAIRVRLALEGMGKTKKRRKTILIILTTRGGSIEATKTIVNTLRNFYDTVHFLVPVEAMSAGTVLVMSGDKIYMDYFSRLGPIDPQILRNKEYVPALSYLRQYEKMRERAENGTLTRADMVLLDKLDLAELDSIELAKDLSVFLITEWLSDYKFKDWNDKKTGLPVDKNKKQKRAREIAEKLNDQEKWFVHGHGIHMDVLRNELRLVIDDYSQDGKLKPLVWKYWWMVFDGYPSLVHSREFI